MQVSEIGVHVILAAAWNPNSMDEAMLSRLRRSVEKFGMLAPLVVRETADGRYETIGGAQRLAVLKDLSFTTAPCIVVRADDAEARLLAQALNRISGEDDPAMKADALRRILETLPAGDVLELLPDSAKYLKGLSEIGAESLCEHLRAWQKAQGARLQHLTAQFSTAQFGTVQKALAAAAAGAPDDPANPNKRGNALFLICKTYLSTRPESKKPRKNRLAR